MWKKPNGFYLSLAFKRFKLKKKKLLLAGAALLLAAAAVIGFSAYEGSNISDLLNAYVEALARGEEAKCSGPKNNDAICTCWNQISCLDNHGCQW